MTTPSPVHLLIRTRIENPGSIEHYYARCGHNGTTKREFSQDLRRVTKRKQLVQVVTCRACLQSVRASIAAMVAERRQG